MHIIICSRKGNKDASNNCEPAGQSPMPKW